MRPLTSDGLAHWKAVAYSLVVSCPYPGEMDRYADRLDAAADEANAAKMRPNDEDDDTAVERSAL